MSEYGGERRQILDAMDEMNEATATYLTAARHMLNVIEDTQDIYGAGYDAGVCSAMEVDVE